MKIVRRHKKFKKNFKARILPNKKLTDQFEKRLLLLLQNPKNPLLRDHKLSGKFSGYRAFSLTGDFRVVYKLEGDAIRLYDVGTHNQVY